MTSTLSLLVTPVVDSAHVLSATGRAVIAVIFAASAGGKFLHYGEFVSALVATRLPRPVTLSTAVALPWCEVGIGVALVGGFHTTEAVEAAFILLAGFVVIIAVGLRGRAGLRCHCHLPGSTGVLGHGALARNALLLLMALATAAGTRIAVGSHVRGLEYLTSTAGRVALMLSAAAMVALLVAEWTIEVLARSSSILRKRLPVPPSVPLVESRATPSVLD
jgi:hypothetical protein